MHMSTGHRDRSVNLCLGCVSALAQVLGHASKKLRLGKPVLTSRPLAARAAGVFLKSGQERGCCQPGNRQFYQAASTKFYSGGALLSTSTIYST
jgi:hypothetical protein